MYDEADLVKEFNIEGKLKTQATYGNLQVGDLGSTFIQHGTDSMSAMANVSE